MRGRPANIDRRIADDSDKALVATFSRSRASPDSMPSRPDFGTEGREIKLRTNFFPVRVPKGPLHEYDVAITPVAGTATRRVKKRIYQLAEQTTAWKQAGMTGRVAHDGSAKLIAAFLLPQPLTIKVPYYDEDESGPPKTGGKEYTLTINFIQEIDTSNLLRYLRGLRCRTEADMPQLLRRSSSVSQLRRAARYRCLEHHPCLCPGQDGGYGRQKSVFLPCCGAASQPGWRPRGVERVLLLDSASS